MLAHTRAKLQGRPYRNEGGGEGGFGGGDFGGGEGGFGGGDFGGGGDGWGGDFGGGSFGGFGGNVERSDLAEINAPGASLTGGNFAGPSEGFGFAPGPVAEAAAAGWADSLAGNTPADSIIVTPAAPAAPVAAIEAIVTPVVSQVVAAVESVVIGIAAALSQAVPVTPDNYSAPSASLTGGNLSTGQVNFGFAPGPVTQADAQAWAADIAGGELPADAAIVKPAEPAKPPATIGTVVKTGLDILLGVLQIASGNPVAVVNGGRSLVTMASDSFSTSPAPSIFASAETPAAPVSLGLGVESFASPASADTGGTANASDGAQGSPVVGFGGVVIGSPAPTTTTSGGGLAALPGLGAALASLFAPPGNTRQLYGQVQTQQQQAAPAIPPALALAGIAGLIFLG